MKTEFIIIVILFIHWVADFVCQSDWQAQNKSKRMDALLLHTLIYSFITAVWWLILLPSRHGVIDTIGITYTWTLITHTITDYFTSRLNSKLWTEKKVHWFFVSVGFDQFIHFTTLILTYSYLIK